MDLTKEDIRRMGLNNIHYSWLEKNIGEKWCSLISSLPNETQWDLWDELTQSKLGKAWDASLKESKS